MCSILPISDHSPDDADMAMDLGDGDADGPHNGAGAGIGAGGAFLLDDADQVALQQTMAETRIWGTDLNVQTCLNVFNVFIEYFGVQVSLALTGTLFNFMHYAIRWHL